MVNVTVERKEVSVGYWHGECVGWGGGGGSLQETFGFGFKVVTFRIRLLSGYAYADDPELGRMFIKLYR